MARQGSYWEPSRRLRVSPFRRDVPPTPEGPLDGHEGGGGQSFAVREKILRCQQHPFGIEDREKVSHPEAVHAPCPPMETELVARHLWLRKARRGAGSRGQGRRANVPIPRAW
jgi:hypothetical protein